MKNALLAVLAVSLVLAVEPAYARRTLSVKSVEPATTVLRNGKADITLVVHGAGTGPCTAIVNIEGGRPRSLNFGAGFPDTQTLRLTLVNTGRHIINIGPRAGSDDCTRTQAVVSVHDSREAPSGASVEDMVIRQQTQAGAEAKNDVRESTTAASRRNKDRLRERAAACPDGWSMASNEGPRFTCRLIPPRALACPEGTKYFSKGVEIGCR